MTRKVYTAKEEKINWISSKIKKFCGLGELSREWKETYKWGKILARLISRLYNELLQCNNDKDKLYQKWAKDLSTHFSKMYKWPISAWKDTQHHWSLGKCKSNHISIRMAIIKKMENKRWQGYGEMGTLCTSGRSGKKFGSSLKN